MRELNEDIKKLKTVQRRQAAEHNTKWVMSSTQTNELNRELNSLRKELDTLERQTATQKELSVASEVTDDRNVEGGPDTTHTNRAKKVLQLINSRRKVVTYDDVKPIGYKLSIKFRVYKLGIDTILKVRPV